jgi:hypothetical protein
MSDRLEAGYRPSAPARMGGSSPPLNDLFVLGDNSLNS